MTKNRDEKPITKKKHEEIVGGERIYKKKNSAYRSADGCREEN